MICDEIKNIKSEKTDLKKFGLSVGLVLLAISMLLFYYENLIYVYLSIISGILILAGLFFPKILFPIQKLWMGLSVILGFVMSRVIISLLFFLMITPLSIMAKMFKKDFLEKKIDRSKSSYWITRERKEYNQIDSERQF